MKFVDDTVVVGLKSHNNESLCLREVENFVDCCGLHNLHRNVKKTKKMLVDFRKSHLVIGSTTVEMVHSFKYLAVHTSRV